MPVICGGTNYYIESLLWKILVDGEERHQRTTSEDDDDSDDDNRSNQELYTRLKEVDPVRADELHPNDRRKVLRSLQVYDRHQQPHSEILLEQRQAK